MGDAWHTTDSWWGSWQVSLFSSLETVLTNLWGKFWWDHTKQTLFFNCRVNYQVILVETYVNITQSPFLSLLLFSFIDSLSCLCVVRTAGESRTFLFHKAFPEDTVSSFAAWNTSKPGVSMPPHYSTACCGSWYEREADPGLPEVWKFPQAGFQLPTKQFGPNSQKDMSWVEDPWKLYFLSLILACSWEVWLGWLKSWFQIIENKIRKPFFILETIEILWVLFIFPISSASFPSILDSKYEPHQDLELLLVNYPELGLRS